MSQLRNKKNSVYNKLEDNRENDPVALMERAADIIWRGSKDSIKDGNVSRVSDKSVAKIMTAAIKMYAAKTDGELRTFRPLLGKYDEIVTPTEALTTVTEVLRSLQLGPMEFGLWSRRRPEDYYNEKFEDEENKNK